MQSINPADFFGSLRVPLASFPAIISGLLLLCVANYTWTLSSAVSRRGKVMRLALAPPAIYAFVQFAYADYGVLGRLTTVGMTVVRTFTDANL